MKTIKIVPLQEKYMQDYLQIFDAIAKEEVFFGVTHGPSYEDAQKYIGQSIQMGVPFLLARDMQKDKTIGWCEVQPQSGQTGALTMGILGEYRFCGIGRMLLCHVLEAAKKFGFQRIELQVRTTNTAAINLYTALGFLQIAILKNGMIVDEIGHDVVLMYIEL